MAALLVAGGVRDPNVRAILESARTHKIDTVPLLTGEGCQPSLTWDLDTEALRVDRKETTITAAFVRRDVFHGGEPDSDYRARAWYAAAEGWLATHPAVRLLNRKRLGQYTNKLHVLHLARTVGLAVPTTVVTNEVARLGISGRPTRMIAKPISGGGYCRSLDAVLSDTESRDGVAAAPAIVQGQVDGPDVRIYRIRSTCVGFRIAADALDYRQSERRDIAVIDRLPRATVERLGRLMDHLEMDWGAADFKASPATGELTFLEINSNPMFSAFDRIAGGTIASAVISFLSPRR